MKKRVLVMPIHYHYGKFPPNDVDWSQIIPFLGPAYSEVSRYDGILDAIPDPSILLSPLMTQEAVLSSRIEGTQATFGEVLEFEAEKDNPRFSQQRKHDIGEIINYRNAMRASLNMLKELPLCLRIIKRAHNELLHGVRGQDKALGEFRKTSNWIGPPGCTIEDAKFVPISAEKITEAMKKWEEYIHADSKDKLVKLSILHAEFEAIHPFLDGNGRLGRMFVPLFMFQEGLISSPMFYISEYFEAHRDEYYERLLSVSRNDDWTGWCIFFLKAIESQAKNNKVKAKSILDLYEEMKPRLSQLTRSQYSIHTLDWLMQSPIFKSSDFVHETSIPNPTAKRILNLLKKEGILKQVKEGAGRSPAILAFPQLLEIAESR